MTLKPILPSLLAVLMTLAAPIVSAEMTSQPVVYTQDKLNISVANNQPEFTIKLKSNPTTGYSWFLREYNTSVLTPINHSFQAPDKKLMGAPGFELWTFRVKPAGFIVPQQNTIRFVYARPWQQDGSTQLLFVVNTQGK